MNERKSRYIKPNIEVIIRENNCPHERFGIRWLVQSPWSKMPHDLALMIATMCNQCGMFWGYPCTEIMSDKEVAKRPISAVSMDGGIGLTIVGRLQHAEDCSRPDPMMDGALHLLRAVPTSEPVPSGVRRGLSLTGRCEECREPLYFPDAYRLSPAEWERVPASWSGAICHPMRDRIVVVVGESIFRESIHPSDRYPTPPAPPLPGEE